MTELITKALVESQSKAPMPGANNPQQSKEPRLTGTFGLADEPIPGSFLMKDPSVQKVSPNQERQSLMMQLPPVK